MYMGNLAYYLVGWQVLPSEKYASGYCVNIMSMLHWKFVCQRSYGLHLPLPHATKCTE